MLPPIQKPTKQRRTLRRRSRLQPRFNSTGTGGKKNATRVKKMSMKVKPLSLDHLPLY